MATKESSWKCAHSASIISETNTQAIIRVTSYWENLGWSYDINYVSSWVYCNGKEHEVKKNGSVDAPNSNSKYSMGYHDFTIDKTTATQKISCYAKITSNSSYVSGTKTSTATSVSVDSKKYHTISYDSTGGSGTPSNQTKWYNESIKLSSTVPVKTGYTFVSWCTNTSGTGTKYNPGDTYSSNANLTLYAIWEANKYTVTYNANGGSNAPAQQTKTYGVNLTLSSSIPTRTYYNFLGWSTSTNGTVMYKAGSVYSNNTSVTLYAVWELAYTKPRINNYTVQRCTSGGVIDDSGTYLKIIFDWYTDEPVAEIKMEWKPQTSIWANCTSEVHSATGTSGYVNKIVGSGQVSIETAYDVRIYVADTIDSSYSPTRNVPTPEYPIDILHDGLGVAFGKAAELVDTAEFKFKAKFNNGIDGDLVLNNGNLDIFDGYVYINGEECTISLGGDYINMNGTTGNITAGGTIESASGYKQSGNTILRHSGGNTILSASSGYNLYLRPNGDSNDTGRVMIKTDGTITAMGGSTQIYGCKVLYTNTNGSNAEITLNETSANFSYIEIFYKNNDGYYSSVKVESPNGKTACLMSIDPNSSATLYFKGTSVVISGTSIKPNHYSEFGVKSSGITGFSSTNYNYITKVIGYK